MATSRSTNNGPEGSHVSVLDLQIDWSNLFEEADAPGDTVAEIAEKTGRHIRTVRDAVYGKVQAGLLIKGRAARVGSDGRRRTQNVYRPA